MHFARVLTAALAASLAECHPGHDEAKEIAERQAFLIDSRSDLSHCAETLRAQGLVGRNIQRRSQTLQRFAKKRSLKGRQTSAIDRPHQSNHNYTPESNISTIFAGSNSCVLTPEQIDGPYYVAGERIRQDLRENQEGITLVLDFQVIDVDTCKPIPGAYIDIWHCNSTGVYGGVSADGNGVGSGDKANLNNTWLRGVQKTGEDGAVQFTSLFPGFYQGRTTHIHVAVHLNATAQANGTLIDTTAAHVGQTYFDEDLTAKVNKLAPYTNNKQTFTTNNQDMLLSALSNSSDPIMEYTLLGDRLDDGILAWISMGVNTSFVHTIVPAVTLYEGGGKPNPDAMVGPPPGGTGFPPGGVGFPPGGGPPSLPPPSSSRPGVL